MLSVQSGKWLQSVPTIVASCSLILIVCNLPYLRIMSGLFIRWHQVPPPSPSHFNFTARNPSYRSWGDFPDDARTQAMLAIQDAGETFYSVIWLDPITFIASLIACHCAFRQNTGTSILKAVPFVVLGKLWYGIYAVHWWIQYSSVQTFYGLPPNVDPYFASSYECDGQKNALFFLATSCAILAAGALVHAFQLLVSKV